MRNTSIALGIEMLEDMIRQFWEVEGAAGTNQAAIDLLDEELPRRERFPAASTAAENDDDILMEVNRGGTMLGLPADEATLNEALHDVA